MANPKREKEKKKICYTDPLIFFFFPPNCWFDPTDHRDWRLMGHMMQSGAVKNRNNKKKNLFSLTRCDRPLSLFLLHQWSVFSPH